MPTNSLLPLLSDNTVISLGASCMPTRQPHNDELIILFKVGKPLFGLPGKARYLSTPTA